MNAIALNQGRSLTDLDWKVVEVARRDGPLSLNPDGPRARFLRKFFGFPIARGLANERAEAFRRFCVRAWHWDLIRIRDLRPVLEAGYSMDDVDRVLAHVAGFRGFTPSVQEAAA